MSSPYFNTILTTDVGIKPRQMNNNIIENLTDNLIKTYSNKCFQKYGYIEKIYGLDTDNGKGYEGGIIKAEDPTSSALYRVTFKCRLCNPINGMRIVAKIVGINNQLIMAETGPIRFIIGNNNINKTNIKFSQSKNAFYSIDDKGNIINEKAPIVNGSYVIIKVLNKKIVDKNDKIQVLGLLESEANDREIKKSINDIYDGEDNVIIDADEYVKQEITET